LEMLKYDNTDVELMLDPCFNSLLEMPAAPT